MGSPRNSVRAPYNMHSKLIIFRKSRSDIPMERSMASSRLRSLILVEMVLNTLATAISEIIATNT